MKKIVSLLLTVCMCLSVCVMLTACGHEHTYKAEWSKDATHHWHACEGVDCTDIADKAEHSYGDWALVDNTQHKKTCECGAEQVENHEWDDGKEVKPAAKDEDGEIEYTCVHCGATRIDVLEYIPTTTVSEEEWHNAFNRIIVNGTVKEETIKAGLTVDENGKVTIESSEVLSTLITKWSGTSVELINVTSEGNESQYAETNMPEGFPLTYVNFYFKGVGMLEFSSFIYDPDTKAYSCLLYNDNGSLSQMCSIYIEDGFVTRLFYAMVDASSDGTLYDVHDHYVYDLGTTVISNAE